MSDLFYRAYEDRHRGSRELIKSRLRVYAPFLQPAASLFQPATAIDLGCGRGEWLEILRENGFNAFGVDLDDGMLDGCRELGLDARKADAVQSLRDLPTGCLALVSAFHVVEHMPFDVVRTLIEEALRVLRPGGLLILETPNPENLVVGASSFYQDPSHVRPVPSELLSFAVEFAGFARNKLLRLQEAPELHSGRAPSLLDVLGGVSPDYAIVGQKQADASTLSRFDAAFVMPYGVALGELADRFDGKVEKRMAERIEQAEARLAQHAEMLAERAFRLESRHTEIESRLAQAVQRIEQAEERAAAASDQLRAVLQSRSWRITAPLRQGADAARRLRAAAREGRLGRAFVNRAKAAVRVAGRAALSEPRVARLAFRVLARFPALKKRLRDVILPPVLKQQTQRPDMLSPRAARVRDALKKAFDARKN
ncbi:MAG TPA: class I SAM-dependent methyltransferase [Noviherbaspirillum sp.]|nr:class I SAM-dependent methyltransferase [Noviherbaspirillum sp.]